MDTSKILSVLGICWLFIYGCSEQEGMQPVNKNDSQPQQVSNVIVENMPGGATISYTLPESENILYIKAVYEIREGVEQEVKSSYYNKSIKIEGFPDTRQYDVQLYTVSRGEVASEPLTVQVNPLSPPVLEAFKSLEAEATFGGIKVDFVNEAEANLVLTVLAADSAGDLQTADRLYTQSAAGQFATRGFESREQRFGIFVRDRWDNRSDTLFVALTPLPEVQLDKSKFRAVDLPGDNTVQHCCGDGVSDVWDGVWADGQEVFHTKPQNGIPVSFTIDLGASMQLSRFVFHHRGAATPGSANGEYTGGDVKVFEIYGSNDPASDGSWDSWTRLGTFESIKPSTDANENWQFAVIDGEGFEFPLDIPSVRYLRVRAVETWGGLTYAYISELTFFGNPE